MMTTLRGIRPPMIDSWRLALLVVFLAALAVRLYGLDWDDGADLHPDELFVAKIVLIDRIRLDWPPDIGRLLDPARSGLNPRSADPATGQFREFAYGALPLWITDGVAWLLTRLTGEDWNAMDRAYLVGRGLSALLSALTVVPIAALGAAVGGRSIGLLAALFAALAPMSIQLAHFFTTDSWLTFFVTLCLCSSMRAALDGRLSWFVTAGIAFGLAMATKGSVFTLAIPIAAAVALHAFRHWQGHAFRHAAALVLGRGFVAAMAAVLAFCVFEPYAMLRPDVYLHSLRVQADIASGTFDVPFTRVYVGTVPILYQLEQFVRWGYGPVAGLLALAGIVLLIGMALRRQSAAATVLVAWLAAYGPVLAVSDVKFLRYLEPLAPVFAVAAALALAKLSLAARVAWRPPYGWAVPVAVLLCTVAWSGAFLSIFAHEHPRLSASHWIYGAVPPGSALTAEYWDDALPRNLSYAFSPAAYGFETVTLDLYRDLEPEEASASIFAGIRDADYIVQSSDRVESAIHAAPWRYPVQGRYFDQLERGNLGFDLVAAAESQPRLGPLVIDDRRADESFINYDHPNVAIYARTNPLSQSDYDAVMSWALQRPWFPTREPPEPTLLLDTPVGENPSVDDARWSAAVTSHTAVAVAVWIVLMLVLLLVGLPLARWLLPAFPDQGWGLARVFALTVAAYPVWLGASLHLFRFRALWVAAALLILGAIGWRLYRRHVTSVSQGPEPAKPRLWLHAEVVFWLVLAMFLAFRLIVPDGWHPLWGGEKPMEFALINAIGRGAYFPPYDPWFADGYVNYYYYGFYLVSFLFKATGIPAEIGFNLALPTVMAMLASGGFTVAAALAQRLTRSSRLALVGGWCGAISLSLLGNLTAIRGVIDGGALRGDPFIFWTWNGSRAIDNAITEFPYFSGLYADLHSHVIALPLTVAVIALCLATATSGVPAQFSLTPASLAMVARLAMLALLLGSLSATNAWDVPVYAALVVASAVLATVGLHPMRRRALTVAVSSLGVGLGAWLLFLPFHSSFVALFGSLAIVRDPTDLLQFLSHLGGLLAIGAVGLTVLLMRPFPNEREPTASSKSAPWPWVVLAAATLGLIGVTQGTSAWTAIAGQVLIVAAFAAPPLAAAWQNGSLKLIGTTSLDWLPRIALTAAAMIALANILSGRAVFALLFLLGAAAAAGFLRMQRRGEQFACLLMAAACFTAAGVEIVVVADDLIETTAYRMNTIFKFYNQVWVLLAIAGSGFVAVMIREVIRAARRRSSHRAPSSGRVAWSRLGVAVAMLVLVAGIAYPALATGPRLAQRFTPGTPAATLDALRWMEHGTVSSSAELDPSIDFAGDAAVIAWLLANVSGTPVIAEASIGPYRCNGSRISAATGLPTIIGWERHQQQQRYPESLPVRVEDVRRLYTSTDPAEKASILRRYNVEFVVVGDLERHYPIPDNDCSPRGSPAGIATFDEMVGETLDVAFASAGTTLYRVLPVTA